MMRLDTSLTTKWTVSLLCLMACLAPARGQGGLKTFDNPGGGQMVYGPLEEQSSLPNAMGFMLRMVHGHFGERPRIGRFFHAGGSNSVATFFTLTAKTQGGKRLAGMVIISKPEGAAPAAAVLYDDETRFGKTANPLLKKLNAVWHQDTARPTATGTRSGSSETGPAHESEPLPLHQTPFPDGSGSIGLPTGWQITGAAGGGVHTAGPKGESVHLGVIMQNIYDTRNPRAQSMLRYLSMAHQPYFACPYGGDLVAAYRTIAQQNRQRQNLPVPTLKVINATNLPATPYETAVVLVLGELDMNEGKGPLKCSLRIGAMKLGMAGSWAMTISSVLVPAPLADDEWPTMRAIVGSWRQNGAVIQKQTDAVIANIRQIGKDAKDRMDRFHEANDRHNREVEKNWDTQDKYSKSFQNYQFDQSVVQDNNTGAHGTMGYQSADWLVKSDPNRFQYVQTQDFLKGIDY